MIAAPGHFPLLDIVRVGRLLEEELNAFRRDLTIHPVDVIQDYRAAMIAWTAVFLPEAVSVVFTEKLIDIANDMRHRPDFGTWGWYRTTLLDVTLFALTDDPMWLDICKRHYSQQIQQLRTPVMNALAFVVHRLDFDDEELREYAEQNLNWCHFRCEWSAALVLTAPGDAASKREWLTEWLARGKFLNPHERETLKPLAEGYSVPNSYFLNYFLRIQHYVMTRLACALPPLYIQGTLLEIPPEQTALDLPPEEIDFAALLWKRLQDHPLMQYHVRILD